jgi:hypothetical protein
MFLLPNSEPRVELKDPGFDLNWLAVAFQKAIALPDDVKRFSVEMLLPFDVHTMKGEFAIHTSEILEGIQSSRR